MPDLDKQDLNQLPEILKEEIEHLYALRLENDYYGIVLKIKDIFELFIKVPVSIVLNGILIRTTEDATSPYAREILQMCLTKPLSLGDWERIAHNLKNATAEDDPIFNQPIYRQTVFYLNKLLKKYKYKGKSITTWRNDQIGHSALSKIDEAFIDELDQLTDLIQLMLELSLPYYGSFEFKRAVDSDDMYIVYDGHRLIMHPFIQSVIDIDSAQKMYLFDSYLHNKNEVYYLNYSHGGKMKSKSLSSPFQKVIKNLEMDNLTAASIDSKDILTRLRQDIKIIKNRKNYVMPMHFMDYTASVLSSMPRGLHFIQAERGMGKSVFSQILDELDRTKAKGKMPQVFKESIIRVFHVHTILGQKDSYFRSELRRILNTISATSGPLYQGEYDELFDDLADADHPEEKRLLLSAILKKAYELLNEHNGYDKKRLVLIIDGLDEMVLRSHDEENFLSLLPKEAELPSGIHIILTSRTMDEVSENIGLIKRIETIETSSQKVFRRKDHAYISTLESFVASNTNRYSQSELKDLLLSLDYRFPSLNAYIRFAANPLINMDKIDLGNVLVSYIQYAQSVNKRYGEEVKLLAVLLANTPGGMTINELADYMGFHSISFRLLGLIYDMADFIYFDRRGEEEVMTLSHALWIESIQHEYKDAYASFLVSFDGEVKEWINDLYSEDYSLYELKEKKNQERILFEWMTYRLNELNSSYGTLGYARYIADRSLSSADTYTENQKAYFDLIYDWIRKIFEVEALGKYFFKVAFHIRLERLLIICQEKLPNKDITPTCYYYLYADQYNDPYQQNQELIKREVELYAYVTLLFYSLRMKVESDTVLASKKKPYKGQKKVSPKKVKTIVNSSEIENVIAWMNALSMEKEELYLYLLCIRLDMILVNMTVRRFLLDKPLSNYFDELKLSYQECRIAEFKTPLSLFKRLLKVRYLYKKTDKHIGVKCLRWTYLAFYQLYSEIYYRRKAHKGGYDRVVVAKMHNAKYDEAFYLVYALPLLLYTLIDSMGGLLVLEKWEHYEYKMLYDNGSLNNGKIIKDIEIYRIIKEMRFKGPWELHLMAIYKNYLGQGEFERIYRVHGDLISVTETVFGGINPKWKFKKRSLQIYRILKRFILDEFRRESIEITDSHGILCKTLFRAQYELALYDDTIDTALEIVKIYELKDAYNELLTMLIDSMRWLKVTKNHVSDEGFALLIDKLLSLADIDRPIDEKRAIEFLDTMIGHQMLLKDSNQADVFRRFVYNQVKRSSPSLVDLKFLDVLTKGLSKVADEDFFVLDYFDKIKACIDQSSPSNAEIDRIEIVLLFRYGKFHEIKGAYDLANDYMDHALSKLESFESKYSACEEDASLVRNFKFMILEALDELYKKMDKEVKSSNQVLLAGYQDRNKVHLDTNIGDTVNLLDCLNNQELSQAKLLQGSFMKRSGRKS